MTVNPSANKNNGISLLCERNSLLHQVFISRPGQLNLLAIFSGLGSRVTALSPEETLIIIGFVTFSKHHVNIIANKITDSLKRSDFVKGVYLRTSTPAGKPPVGIVANHGYCVNLTFIHRQYAVIFEQYNSFTCHFECLLLVFRNISFPRPMVGKGGIPVHQA